MAGRNVIDLPHIGRRSRKLYLPPPAPVERRVLLPTEFSPLSGEDSRIDAFRITENNEANVPHVFLRHPLHIPPRARTQLLDKSSRIAPAATEQFSRRKFTGLA